MANQDESSSSSIGSMLGKLNSFIFEKNKKVTYVVSPIIIVILTFAVFSWEASDKADQVLGADAIEAIISGGGGKNFDPNLLSRYTEQMAVSNADGDLSEGSSATFTVESSSERLVRQIDIDVRWSDESNPPGIRLRNYENQPDSFSVSISHPDGNMTHLGESDSGSVSGSISFTDDDIERMFDSGNFTITVKLENAGDWEANLGFGFLNMPDSGNSFTIEINEKFLAAQQE